ncbi:MAG: hypothetical protein LBE18_08630 [Planctomycetaceae bacterium]|jgi:hypothetical protein|nr:hypothetical protein [Planctomycetaceae bacterium]
MKNLQYIRESLSQNRLENEADILHAIDCAGILAMYKDVEPVKKLVNCIDEKFGKKKLKSILLDYCLKGIREAKTYDFGDIMRATVTMEAFSILIRMYKSRLTEIKDFLQEWKDSISLKGIVDSDIMAFVNSNQKTSSKTFTYKDRNDGYTLKVNLKKVDNNDADNLDADANNDSNKNDNEDEYENDDDNNFDEDNNNDVEDEYEDDEDDNDEYDEDEDDEDEDEEDEDDDDDDEGGDEDDDDDDDEYEYEEDEDDDDDDEDDDDEDDNKIRITIMSFGVNGLPNLSDLPNMFNKHSRPPGPMQSILGAICCTRYAAPILIKEVPPNGVVEIDGNILKFQFSRDGYKLVLVEDDGNLFTIVKLQISGVPFIVSKNSNIWQVNLEIFPVNKRKEILKKPLIANLSCGVQLQFPVTVHAKKRR